MNSLENLLRRGWQLKVERDGHDGAKFHAVVYRRSVNGDDSHHYLGQSISEALFRLDEYVAGRESPSLETGTARRCRCGQVEWEDGARRISCGDGSDHYVDLDCVSAPAVPMKASEEQVMFDAVLKRTKETRVEHEPEYTCECGHDHGQHTKGPVQADYCRHCPCEKFKAADLSHL